MPEVERVSLNTNNKHAEYLKHKDAVICYLLFDGNMFIVEIVKRVYYWKCTEHCIVVLWLTMRYLSFTYVTRRLQKCIVKGKIYIIDVFLVSISFQKYKWTVCLISININI